MSHLNEIIRLICIAAIPLIFAITLHEAAHGWIASKFGDQTARIMGRVSLNPIRHIDPFGTIFLPLIMLAFGGFIFGWAKPVPIAWKNLHNPRRDMAFVAAAGPVANLAMALLWACLAKISHIIFINPHIHETLRSTVLFLHLTSRFGIMINCVLFVINLIPIPPLDGSRIVTSVLPPLWAKKYNRLEIYGLWIFLGLVALLVFTNSIGIIWTPINGLMQWIYQLLSLPT